MCCDNFLAQCSWDNEHIQGDSEKSLEKKNPVIGDDEKKSLTKIFSYK
jgi:hypothetical protein